MENPAGTLPASQKLLDAARQPAAADARPVVREVLETATGSDALQRAHALKLHQELEQLEGYALLLLEAYRDPTAQPKGRQLAVMTCKHVITRNWSGRNGYRMSDQEKKSTKDTVLRLISSAGELPFLTELALVLRRICRFDFPLNWAELGQHLLGEFQSIQGPEHLNDRGLAAIKLLHHVLKEQSTKRLPRDRNAFYQLGETFLGPIGRVWGMLAQMLKDSQRNNPAALNNERIWEQSRYLDGCFMLLLCGGFGALHEVVGGSTCVANLKEKFVFMLELSKTTELVTQSVYFRKNLKSVSKWMPKLLEKQPLAFAQANVGTILETSAKVIETFGAPLKQQGANAFTHFCELLVYNSVETLTKALGCPAFRPGSEFPESSSGLGQQCNQQMSTFLAGAGIGNLVDLVSAHTLEWPAQDLQEWLADPEDQIAGPGSATELRKAATSFFQVISTEPLQGPFLQHLAQHFQQQMASPPGAQDPYIQADAPTLPVAKRDAMLSLLSICHDALKPHLPFEALMDFLMPFARLLGQGLPQNAPAVLLPVRMCQVLRTWHAKLPGSMVGPVLQMLEDFLDPRCPKAVRLAAMGPVADMASAFPEDMAWCERNLTRSVLNLLMQVQSEEFIWKCLNLATMLLKVCPLDQVDDNHLRCFRQIWQVTLAGTDFVGGALLDLLVELVASVRPLSQNFLFCSNEIAQSCSSHYQAPALNNSSGLSSAALASDLDGAADAGGDESYTATAMLKSGHGLVAALQKVSQAHIAPQRAG